MGNTAEATVATKTVEVHYGASVVSVEVPIEATANQIIEAAKEQADLIIDQNDVSSVKFDGNDGQVVTNNTEVVSFTPSVRTNG